MLRIIMLSCLAPQSTLRRAVGCEALAREALCSSLSACYSRACFFHNGISCVVLEEASS